MKVLNRIEHVVEKLIMGLSGTGMAAITVVIFVQVIYRYILGHSLSWAEEISLYIEVWVVFLCSGYALGKGQHICMDMLSSHMPPMIQFIFQKIISVICLAFALFCTRYAWIYVLAEQGQTMSALRLPKWIAYGAMLAGSVLMIFYCILLVLEPPVHSGSSSEIGEGDATC